MKKIIGLIFAALIVIAGFSMNSSAQTRKWSVNSREHRQQKRIYQGARNGTLTPKETYRLERQQIQIRRTEARYRNSGDGLSRREKSILERKLNQSSRSIYRQKHDKQNYQHPQRRM